MATLFTKKCSRLLPAFLFIFLLPAYMMGQNYPAGFSQVKVVSLQAATAMAFAPDGRLFVCTKDGTVRVVKNGVLLNTPFLTLTVDQNGERGISGITFDPSFNSNHYVYIYYTATTPSIHNRLSRFTANGDVVQAGSEFTLLDAEAVINVFHNGGGLAFGPDGKLYLSMGEDNKPNNAQNLGVYKGKMLRINPDGSAPSDNPYSNSPNPVTKRIWSLGLRNPYTLSFQPGTGKLFVNNVGADSWEEINDATLPDKNFGWPDEEGNGPNPAYTDPVFAYPHEAAGQHGCAIVGGTFFNPQSTNYPNQYIGKYFYMDYCNGWMYYLTLGNQVTNTSFSSGMGTKNLALRVGPDGNLYYLSRDEAKAGVYKIIYSNNNAPIITSQPSNVTVPEGQPASFSVSASGAMPLSYQWKKNGTNIPGATSATYTIAHAQQADAGQYRATVSNNYGSATSNDATLTVTAFNAAPTATIVIPSPGTYYHAGDVISFSGNGTDPEDGTLAAAAFTWEVQFHHNVHFHPGPAIAPGIKNGSFTIPNTGETAPDVFYRLVLVVRDAGGLTDTAYVDIQPLTSTVSLNTQPAGLRITYDSQPKTAPFSTLAVEGMQIPIGVVSPQNAGGHTYVFDHWMHGGAATQTITIGASDSSYTAVYKDTVITCQASGTIVREYWANVPGDHVDQVPVNTHPTSTSQLSLFEAPPDAGDNYGARIRGYICPPATGNYTFWIAANNDAELWLSTNDDPAHKTKIAYVTGWTNPREWTKYPSQQSPPVELAAGMKYYIEALHKEGTQGDHVSVGWQLPNGTLERPIPGAYLSPDTMQAANDPQLIAVNTDWKYLDNGSNQGTQWRNLGFNDSGWKTGNAQLGYGDGDEATVVGYGGNASSKYITTYFRKSFQVADANAFTGLELSLMRDDGAVVYLNGTEVYRNNMPAGTIFYNSLAPNYIDGASESAYLVVNISKSALVTGNNVIAVEIHQNSPSSSDISFNLGLKGTSQPPADLVSKNAVWKYLDNGSNQGSTWRGTSFNDGSWKTGNAELGYGDGDEATVVGYGGNASSKFITTYFRKSFQVADANAYTGLELHLLRDDGAVVYLNGTEVHRSNMPAGSITYTTLASTYIDGANESTYQAMNISKNALVSGNNVLAVEIHQNAKSSSDISFNLELHGITGAGKKGDDLPGDTTTVAETKQPIDNNAGDFLLYPNPNSGQFNLEFCVDGVEEKTLNIEIMNPAGQVVYRKEPAKINGCIREVITLDNSLATGIYIMNITTDGKTESKRILLTD